MTARLRPSSHSARVGGEMLVGQDRVTDVGVGEGVSDAGFDDGGVDAGGDVAADAAFRSRPTRSAKVQVNHPA